MRSSDSNAPTSVENSTGGGLGLPEIILEFMLEPSWNHLGWVLEPILTMLLQGKIGNSFISAISALRENSAAKQFFY